MNLKINRILFSFIASGLLFIVIPTTTYADGINNLNKLFVVSQPSSIDNPVVDPNFNVMRSKDTESSTATYIVIGLLIAATIIPLATWWYFSK